MTHRPELKQFGDLCAADFARHPVWVSVHSVDYDAAWYGESNEETFRPWTAALPVGTEAMYLVQATFTLADGSTLAGFATPAAATDDWGTIQPQIFLPEGRRAGVWFGLFPPPAALADFCRDLGKTRHGIFPLRLSVADGLTSGVCTGTIHGLMKSAKPSFALLTD